MSEKFNVMTEPGPKYSVYKRGNVTPVATFTEKSDAVQAEIAKIPKGEVRWIPILGISHFNNYSCRFTFMIGFPVGWKVGSAHANDRILSQCLNTGQTTVAGVKFKCELERQGQQENTDGTPAR